MQTKLQELEESIKTTTARLNSSLEDIQKKLVELPREQVS